MERVTKRLALAAVAVVLAAALSTCWNDFAFLDVVTDQVMVARDLYLEVTSTTPTKDLTGVSTWASIDIYFDRDVDMETVDDTTVTIDPPVALGEFGWNPSTKALTMKPLMLQGLTKYTVTITEAVKGSDGSPIRSAYSWSFTTKKAPSGTITINDDADYAQNATVTLNLSYNTEAVWVRWSETKWATGDDTGWFKTSDIGTTETITLSAGDGTKTLYYEFLGEDDVTKTPLASDTIIVDTVDPLVNAGADKTINLASPSLTIDATVSDATSGIKTISWTKTSGTGTVTFGSDATADTSVSMSVDGTYVLTLTVTDNAGRTASDSVTVNQDLAAPSVSVAGTWYLNRTLPTKTITATTSDNLGIATWAWVQTSGPGTLTFTTPNAEDTDVSGDKDGTYTARLTVTDNYGNSKQASITIYRDIIDPVLSNWVAFPAYLNIAAPSYTPSLTATDANTLRYSWKQIAGTKGAITFSDDKALNSTINAAIDAKDVQVQLTVSDVVGNSVVRQSTLFTIDRVAPNAPAVTDPTSPTTDTSPTWTWLPGGGGNGNYQYKFDSGSWVATTGTEATLSITAAQFGTHYSYVQERDDAGNWSPSNSDSLFIYPSWNLPKEGLKNIDCSPKIQWGPGIVSGVVYAVYAKKSTDSSYAVLVKDTEEVTFQISYKTPLDKSTEYNWYYIRKDKAGTIRFPSGTQYFTFTTGTTNTIP